VLVNGVTVPQDMRRGHEDLQPPYTTYYEQIDDKYWFPVYTRAEGILHFAAHDGQLSLDIHIRTVVKYSDYKQFHTSVTIHYNGEEVTDQSDQNKPKTQTPPK